MYNWNKYIILNSWMTVAELNPNATTGFEFYSSSSGCIRMCVCVCVRACVWPRILIHLYVRALHRGTYLQISFEMLLPIEPFNCQYIPFCILNPVFISLALKAIGLTWNPIC